MYLLSSCCCGCSLKNGTKAIGIFSIISVVYENILRYFGSDPVSNDMGLIKITEWEWILSSIALFLAAIFLLLADVTNKPGFLMPWLKLQAGGIIIFPYYLYLISVRLNTALYLSIVLGFGIAGLVLAIYIWFVVFSYYKELKSTVIVAKEYPTIPV